MGVPSSLTFADLLRYHRTAAGLTQEELAAQARLSVDAVSTLERGTRRRPRKDTVALLADALALSSDDRAALVSAARRPPADPLAAIPHEDAARNERLPATTGDLPRGVVTFLFADIEGSAQLLQQLGGRYADLLAELQELLHTVYTVHHGRELGTQGDRFFAVFARPDDAASAAVEAQQALARHPWPEGVDVRLRMGIHTGGALVTAGRYVGLEVARAAHLAAAGHGGQILLSREAVEEVTKRGQAFPPGTAARYLGTHRLGNIGSSESIIQLVLPDTPGLPTRFPPLRTLDLWPIVRSRLLAVALLTLTLLALVGLLLPFVVPTFPRVFGLVAGVADLLLVVGVALAPTPQTRLRRQWRAMRQPVVALTSGLLSLVVVLTTLFASLPRQVIASRQQSVNGYDFSYTYHQPTHTGGSITIGTGGPNDTFAPPGLIDPTMMTYAGLWQGCVVQLPKVSLGADSWRADQCSEVPTVLNGGESPDQRRTTFHIDPRAVWSDGAPITADDYLFSFHIYKDTNVSWYSGGPPFSYMTLKKIDLRTLQIDWSVGYGLYLDALEQLIPLPLHVYATGAFANVFDPATGAYNSALAQRMVAQARFNTTIPVDNGPFIVQSVYPPSPDTMSLDPLQMFAHSLSRVVLVRNPRFFSNFFHHPAALDQVTILSFAKNAAVNTNDVQSIWRAGEEDTIAAYRRGELTLTDGLDANILPQVKDIPAREVITSPQDALDVIAFNQRAVSPNAQANGGVSVFLDRDVRQAFVEAFDRCAAVKALLGIHDCTDPNFFTDEYTVPMISDYDPSVTLPAYNHTAAAALLERAGYHVVGGIRRFKDGITPFAVTILVSLHGTADEVIADHMAQDYERNLQIRAKVVVPKRQPFAPFGQGGLFSIGAFDIGLYNDGGPPDLMEAYDLDSYDSAADIPTAQNPGGGNFIGVIDPYIAQQLQLSDQAPNVEQRTLIHRDLQRYVTRQYYFEPAFISADVALVKPTLCNFKKWPGYLLTGGSAGSNTWNMADWYVASGSQGCP